MMNCISHSGRLCNICGAYHQHLTDAAMEEDASYIDADAKRNPHYVTFRKSQVVHDELAKMVDMRNHYCDCAWQLKVRLTICKSKSTTLKMKLNDYVQPCLRQWLAMPPAFQPLQ